MEIDNYAIRQCNRQIHISQTIIYKKIYKIPLHLLYFTTPLPPSREIRRRRRSPQSRPDARASRSRARNEVFMNRATDANKLFFLILTTTRAAVCTLLKNLRAVCLLTGSNSFFFVCHSTRGL